MNKKKYINYFNKEKLISLLKSNEDVKTAIEQLEFWCVIESENETIYKIDSEHIYKNNIIRSADWRIYDRISNCKIIWLPLQERFIRMFCKWKYICFHWEKELNIWIYQIQIDNTKDFDNQDDFVYQRIYEALYNINKTKC